MTASSQPSSAVERLSRRTAGALLAVAGAGAVRRRAAVVGGAAAVAAAGAKGNHSSTWCPPRRPRRRCGSSAPGRAHAQAGGVSARTIARRAIGGGAAVRHRRLRPEPVRLRPENYANLPPDARAHCIKPGEGLA